VAAILELEDGMIKSVRLALGGVAHKPWRATKAEQRLIGKKARASAFTAAANAELAGAKAYRYNTFKIELAKRAIVQALTTVAAMT
jgi:xanthine dehydrogenase YagS FAD-binding subunit